MRLCAIIAAFLCLPIASAKAMNVNYDIGHYCNNIVLFADEYSPALKTQCLKEESQARSYLRRTKIPPPVEQHCLDVANITQMMNLGGSYTLLKTCVDQETKALANRHKRQQQKSFFKSLWDRALNFFSFN